MNKLKIVRRVGLPETNSSSSHAVSISTWGNYIVPGDKEWDIEIVDGVLKIPGDVSFGWEFFKSNHIKTKLQYLCGIYCSDIRSCNGKKRISKLKRILKDIFGVRDVEFLWITKYSEQLKKVREYSGPDKCEEAYYDYPEIDHNSSDIFCEITESKETIKNFLFSRDSWLFGGNDNSDPSKVFFNKMPIKETKKVTAIVSIEFGGSIGRIDWEVYDFPFTSIDKALDMDDDFNILSNIYYDTKSSRFLPTSDYSKLLDRSYLTYSRGCYFPTPLFYDGSYYALFSNSIFGEKYSEFNDTKYNVFSQSKIEALKKTIEETIEGVDYVLAPFEIKLLDYNNFRI